jgi:hypothetical protein
MFSNWSLHGNILIIFPPATSFCVTSYSHFLLSRLNYLPRCGPDVVALIRTFGVLFTPLHLVTVLPFPLHLLHCVAQPSPSFLLHFTPIRLSQLCWPYDATVLAVLAPLCVLHDRLCGLVVSVADYKHKRSRVRFPGTPYDFSEELGLERGPLSLVIW